MRDSSHTFAAPPGAAPLPAELAARLAAEFRLRRARGCDARTRHRTADGAPSFANRLLLETSPYLLQHAHNPVDWYPWSDEAFAAAKRAAKPVFLSIGYATCHWCHVMEEESFEDLEIARLLNERYVAIKVDREERPDVDSVYMTAVQALRGAGGWPTSVWLDDERRPFFAGTYFPPRDGERGVAVGFSSLARRLADAYGAEAERVAEAAGSISEAIRTTLAGRAAEPADTYTRATASDVSDAAFAFYESVYDPRSGGTRGAPKFPSSMPVRFLLRRHRRTGEARPLAMAVRTLEAMAAGGLHDQLAGGFHRYSTDERWLVPHFEKMLYDNALLALAYVEAWQVTKRPDFARVARTTLDYLLRELRSPSGGFYAATDADSQGEEGVFYVWSAREIHDLLGAAAERFARFYGVTERGNFEGRSVPFVPQPDESEWNALSSARETLRLARERRPQPLRDDKIVTAWNGLAIAALAAGGRALDAPQYVAAAAAAARFITGVCGPDGRLPRSWNGRPSRVPGFLEDDACFVAGLLALYEATFELPWLDEALRRAEQTETSFGDPAGGWFRTAGDGEQLLAREKPAYDGAEPCGASVALANVLRLHALTADDRYREIAERAFRWYAPVLRARPAALHDMLLAVESSASGTREVVLVWPSGESAPLAFLEPLRTTFLPDVAVLGAAAGDELDALARIALPARAKELMDGGPAAYVCEGGTCRVPVTGGAALRAQLA